jgi:hypothetical protein
VPAVQVNDIFEFTRGSGEAVHMPARHRIQVPGRDVGQHPQPLLARGTHKSS